MVEKRIKAGICHSVHRYAKANNKYMKNYDKNHHILHTQIQAICMDRQCLENYL